MSDFKISNRIIRKILRLKTSPVPFFDMQNKLQIFAVKFGMKAVFAGTVDSHEVESKTCDDIQILKQIAKMAVLKYKLSHAPPLYFSRTPNVPNTFLQSYYNQNNLGTLWIYDNPEIELQIDKCLSEELNEGYLFGYPKCCIEWHEKSRVLEIESSFLDNMEEFDALLYKNVLGTWKKYPFVPHWGCSSCLNGDSKETEKINKKYEALADKIGTQFKKDFLRKNRQQVKKY